MNEHDTTEYTTPEEIPEVLSAANDVSTETPHVPVLKQLSVAFGILALVFGTTYTDDLFNLLGKEQHVEAKATPEYVVTETIDTTPDATDYFDDVSVLAKSAFVWDVRAQRALYNKNADERLPLASVTKLMTALVAYELLDPEDSVNIGVDAINEEGDSGFFDGETFSLRNLTDLTLISSSNDGAHALAAAAGNSLMETEDGTKLFVKAMNIRARELGLTQTTFSNATGLDQSTTESGAYGSARDMAFLMEYIISTYPDLLEETKTVYTAITNENGEVHFTENTNNAIPEIEGIIASKTGYTDLAGGNLVVAFDAGLNRPIIVSVLGSTQNGRFSDVVLLAKRARTSVAAE